MTKPKTRKKSKIRKKKTGQKKPKTRKGLAAYRAYKPRMLNMILARATQVQIAQDAGVSQNTAKNWRLRFMDEEGDLSDSKVAKLKKEFIVKTLAEMEQSKKIMLKLQVHPETTSGQKIKATNAISSLHKTGLEVLSRFNIIAPEKLEIGITDISISFENEPKVKKAKKGGEH